MAETLDIRAESMAVPAMPPLARRGKTQHRPGLAGSLTKAIARRRVFILLPFAMIAGLIASVELPEAAPPALAAGALAIGGAVVLSLRALAWLRLAGLAAAFWLGFCLLALHGALWGTQMLSRPAYGDYQVRVDEILSESGGTMRVIVSDIVPLAGARAVPMRRARLLLRDAPALAPGDVLAGPFRFAPVPGPAYPGGFDAQFHGYFDGIGAYGNSTRPPQLVAAGSAAAPARLVDAIRRGISARIDAVLGQPAAGVARAIVNGDQSAVTDAARDTMATAGIAHVLSVSGLHLTIVAGGVFAALRLVLAGFERLAAHVSVKRIAATGGMAAAVFYYAISGGNVAAFRSTLMILIVFGAVLAGRRALTMRNVAIAGLIVVATDPASVFRPSFQLSFAAVVALIGAYENFRGTGARDAGVVARGWAYGKGIVVTSVVAGLATLVFSIYHFQQTSPLGVLGNLLTLPLVGFVMMPAAALAVLAMPFGLEGPFLVAMAWLIERMLEMAALVAAWSEHLTASPLLTPWALVFGLVALGWFAFFFDRWRLAGPLLAVPLIVLGAVDRPPDVLVADSTQALAVRGATGLELAAGQSRSFALDIWRDTYAEPIAAKAPQSCDSVACIGTSTAGFSYAIVKDPGGFAEECALADLVVTRLEAPSYCAAPAVIDAATLRRHGVHWLRWNSAAHAFEIRAAIEDLARPWRIRP